MAVQLTIPYETLVELVEQLPEVEQDALLERLAQRKARQLSAEEKKRLFHEAIIHTPVNEEPSIRREDWYGDDGLNEIIEQVKQLSPAERRELSQQLQAMDEENATGADQWIAQFEALVLRDVRINEAPSIRREDWYGDDGR